jgi:hypothetical protein
VIYALVILAALGISIRTALLLISAALRCLLTAFGIPTTDDHHQEEDR